MLKINTTWTNLLVNSNKKSICGPVLKCVQKTTIAVEQYSQWYRSTALIKENQHSKYSKCRRMTTAAMGPDEDPSYSKGIIWFDNLFPFKYPLDPRSYFIRNYTKSFMDNAKYKELLPTFPESCSLKVIHAQENLKEGGLYLEFKYSGGTVEEAVDLIQKHLAEQNTKQWFKMGTINAFQVKGSPFVEDLINRIPSKKLIVKFKGPELDIESLYREFRIFGRIVDIGIKDGIATVEFLRKQSATSARNCIHGEKFNDTILTIGYENREQFYKSAGKWFTGNLRLSVPILLAFLAGMSFIIFDPWREFSITNKITGRFDLSKYGSSAYKSSMLLYELILEKIGKVETLQDGLKPSISSEWSERESDQQKLSSNLNHAPESYSLILGPKGSGKSKFINDILKTKQYKLVIQCDELIGKGDYLLISNLSYQLNFYPNFGFISQIGGLVDALITATTGAKANIVATNETQISKMFETVTKSIESITEKQLKERAKLLKKNPNAAEIIYPIIVIDGFLGKEHIRESFIYNEIASWVAQLVESRIAHVVFVSENPSAQQYLAKAFLTKSLDLYTLRDASPKAALEYVRKRLGSKPVDQYIEQLGGRFHDLDIFASKVQTGTDPKDAFDEMVLRAVAETRKLSHLDGTTEKTPWTKIQFWKLVKLFSNSDQIQIDELLADPLFNTDPTPILEMEKVGLITMVLQNGRPYFLKPGRPLFKLAFESMASDQKLDNYMNLQISKKLLFDTTKKIQEYEQELDILNRLHSSGYFGISGITNRRDFLEEMLKADAYKARLYNDQVLQFKKKLKLKD